MAFYHTMLSKYTQPQIAVDKNLMLKVNQNIITVGEIYFCRVLYNNSLVSDFANANTQLQFWALWGQIKFSIIF